MPVNRSASLYLADRAIGVICGFGADSYRLALGAWSTGRVAEVAG